MSALLIGNIFFINPNKLILGFSSLAKALGRGDRLQPWIQTKGAGFFASGFSNEKIFQGFELGKGTVAKSISLTVGKWGQSLALYLLSHAAWAH